MPTPWHTLLRAAPVFATAVVLLAATPESASAIYPCTGPQGQAGSSLTPGGFCYYPLPYEEVCLELMDVQDTTICVPPAAGGSGAGVFGPSGVLQEIATGLSTGRIRPKGAAGLAASQDLLARYVYGIIAARNPNREFLSGWLTRAEQARTAARPPLGRPVSDPGARALARPGVDPATAAVVVWLQAEARHAVQQGRR